MIVGELSKYGPFANLVATTGAVMATVAAIALAFRGRSRWEPAQEDVPSGPQKVGALLAAAGIVLSWSQYVDRSALPGARILASQLVMGAGASLLVYVLLVTLYRYYIVILPERNKTKKRNIIGGFWLTTEAREQRREKKLTIQELLAGAAYDPDKVWSRLSRALAKVCFVVCYLGLTVCGTVGLACLAIIVDLNTKK